MEAKNRVPLLIASGCAVLVCGGLFVAVGVPFLAGLIAGMREPPTMSTPATVWTTDAESCPEACRRAGDCHLEAFLGEGCVDSCESGADVFGCMKKARSCDEMEKCR